MTMLKRIYWFGVGFLAVLVLALAMDTAEAAELTIKDLVVLTDKEHEGAFAYVSGLTRGAFVAYINELQGQGLSFAVAVGVAKSNCGDISPMDLLLAAYANPKLSNAEAALVLPSMVYGACHKKDQTS